MSDRPILFSGALVRAILAGEKTQTRRVVRNPGDWLLAAPVGGTYASIGCFHKLPPHYSAEQDIVSPWGIGDRLWVRETWARVAAPDPVCHCGMELSSHREEHSFVELPDPQDVVYRADTKPLIVPPDPLFGDSGGRVDVFADGSHWLGKWSPSIHMPRRASRLTLDVTEVRVQRLQDISEADAEAEGIGEHPAARAIVDSGVWTWRAAFRAVWDSIYGERPGSSWEDNPWVWAVTFQKVVS